jgi:hypothetical protein
MLQPPSAVQGDDSRGRLSHRKKIAQLICSLCLICVEVDPPSVVERTPPAAPPTQMVMPSIVTAVRGLFAEAKSVSAVVVSSWPAKLTIPTVRGTAVEVDETNEVVPQALCHTR